MEDDFFKIKNCQRCGSSLDGGRIMSMVNEQVICLECKAKERKHPNYKKAIEAEREAVKNGNYNFKGIGFENEN